LNMRVTRSIRLGQTWFECRGASTNLCSRDVGALDCQYPARCAGWEFVTAGTCVLSDTERHASKKHTVRWAAVRVLVVQRQRSALVNTLLQTERARSSRPKMIMGDRVKMQSSEQSAQGKVRLLTSLDIGEMHLHHRVDHYRTVGTDCGS